MGSGDFRWFTRLVKEFADKHCGGRLLVAHEGGYSPELVPFCGLAVLEELTGIPSGVEDPFWFEALHMGERELQPHQAARVDTCLPYLHKLIEKCKLQ